MKYLLDTHVFIWWISDEARLSASVARVIRAQSSELYLSSASAFELAIKARLGRIDLVRPLQPLLVESLEEHGIRELPVMIRHAARVHALPSHHRDPFDHLLIAQAQVEDLTILTADAMIRKYDVKTLW